MSLGPGLQAEMSAWGIGWALWWPSQSMSHLLRLSSYLSKQGWVQEFHLLKDLQMEPCGEQRDIRWDIR